ncbi:FxDxF family PEP-CTERM protein [Zemynaea arenosa]|nr:FxDxF family PEP-CTERM protein [Massilia arenosa]
MAKMKSLVAALALAGASLGAPAFAADISGAPQDIVLTDNAGFFGAVFNMNNEGNTFEDMFRFTAAAGDSVAAIVGSPSLQATSGLDITGFDVYAADGGGAGSLVASGMSLSSGSFDVWTVSAANLEGGDYWLLVSGTMVDNSGAALGGAITLTPVPEPAEYAMLLGGLGVLGWMSRRRKQ